MNVLWCVTFRLKIITLLDREMAEEKRLGK